jgi:predicted RNA binding protein with dsRBD fold (UPF0201 family)
MEFDAFDAGVELGGLRTRDDIKLLVCYLVKSVDGLTKTILNETMQEGGFANYFEVNDALSELVKFGNITIEYIDDDEVLYITDKGKQAAEVLETNLPRTVRERAINCAIRLMTLARRQQENKIDVEKTEKGYNVTFTLADGDDELMKLTVFAADSMQVELLKQNFLNDPVKLYSNILSVLTVE